MDGGEAVAVYRMVEPSWVMDSSECYHHVYCMLIWMYNMPRA